MPITKTIGRYCKNCGERFEPVGKFETMCRDCNEKSMRKRLDKLKNINTFYYFCPNCDKKFKIEIKKGTDPKEITCKYCKSTAYKIKEIDMRKIK